MHEVDRARIALGQGLYAHEPGAFTDDSEQVGLLFAAHAAVAMADAEQVAQLTHARDSRDLIVLARAGQHANAEPTDIAELPGT
ncbi:hypothetical protein AB0H71_03195 [Nocardia sp. NPDC050697]|uniref:hypothetical protein n=1 Tax=Nocardia sp. NPDC050697 TaxID=3155158 RepID=UPI00340A3671